MMSSVPLQFLASQAYAAKKGDKPKVLPEAYVYHRSLKLQVNVAMPGEDPQPLESFLQYKWLM